MVTCPENIDSCHLSKEHRRKWHLNRGISIDTIIALVSVALVLGGAAIRLESRQTKAESVNEEQTRALEAIEKRQRAERDEMREDVKYIREKVDKLIDQPRK